MLPVPQNERVSLVVRQKRELPMTPKHLSLRAVLVHHTDAVRELQPDTHLYRVTLLATEGGWSVIGMKKGWTVIFHQGR